MTNDPHEYKPMSKTLLENIQDMFPDLTYALPTLQGIDFDHILEHTKEIAEKDKRRMLGFVPAVIDRVLTLGVELGIRIGKTPEHEGMDVQTDGVSEEIQKFFNETFAVVKMWEAQVKKTMGGDVFGDPTKNERENTRIWAKRNNVNANYQEILGVSDGTPTEYPEDFDQWL